MKHVGIACLKPLNILNTKDWLSTHGRAVAWGQRLQQELGCKV